MLGFRTRLFSNFIFIAIFSGACISVGQEQDLPAVDLQVQAQAEKEAQKKLVEIEARRQYIKNREKKLFSSATASEATVNFDHEVEIKSDDKPTKETALAQVDAQLGFMFGPLGENENNKDGKVSAVPRGDYEIDRSSVKINRKAGSDNVWVISYSYQGTMLIEDEKAKNSELRIALPNNPDTIYKEAKVSEKHPRCTDDHYFTEGDFWYFWDPSKEGCELEEGKNFAFVAKPKINAGKKEKKSYPNYPKLVKNGVIRGTILLGLDSPKMYAANRNPTTSKDINALTYKKLRKSLAQMGFTAPKRRWTLQEIQKVAPISKEEMVFTPYVETFVKTEPMKVDVNGVMEPLRMEVRLFFGPSGIDEVEEGNAAFHYFYKDALENDSIVVYDGHSGLGGHLDLDGIEEARGFKINMSPDDQIYFFNSCSSYTYYNNSYFERKGGAEKLDIMANGLATTFDVLHQTNLRLLQAIDLWANKRAPHTYQAIAKDIDSGNLFAIVGDEVGNPKSAEEL